MVTKVCPTLVASNFNPNFSHSTAAISNGPWPFFGVFRAATAATRNRRWWQSCFLNFFLNDSLESCFSRTVRMKWVPDAMLRLVLLA